MRSCKKIVCGKSEVSTLWDIYVSPILMLPVHRMILSLCSRVTACFLRFLFPFVAFGYSFLKLGDGQLAETKDKWDYSYLEQSYFLFNICI